MVRFVINEGLGIKDLPPPGPFFMCSPLGTLGYIIFLVVVVRLDHNRAGAPYRVFFHRSRRTRQPGSYVRVGTGFALHTYKAQPGYVRAHLGPIQVGKRLGNVLCICV